MGVKIIFCIISVLIFIFAIYLVYHFFNLLFIPQKKAPYIPTFDRHLEIMKGLELKPNTSIVDLGCGDGKSLRFFVKRFGLKSADGYDINRYAIQKGKYLNKKSNIDNIHLYKKNFLDANLSDYDYIYLYLRDTQLASMEDRIWENKKHDAIIISNSFKFKKHNHYDALKNEKNKDTIFLYK